MEIGWKCESLCVDVLIKDLEIKTNRYGLGVFKKALKEFFIREYSNEELGEDVVEFSFQGFPLRVVHHYKYNLLHRIKKISSRGLALPVLPLREARELYAALGREKTVAVLDRHLG